MKLTSTNFSHHVAEGSRSTWLQLLADVQTVDSDNPWIVEQSVDPRFAQANPQIVQIHDLRITVY